MRRRAFQLATVAAIAIVATSCGSSGDSSDDGVGSIGDAVEVAAEAPAAASAMACDIERTTLELASDVYVTLHGEPPADEQALVDEQLLREPSELYDIAPTGEITPAAGSTCS